MARNVIYAKSVIYGHCDELESWPGWSTEAQQALLSFSGVIRGGTLSESRDKTFLDGPPRIADRRASAAPLHPGYGPSSMRENVIHAEKVIYALLKGHLGKAAQLA